MSKPTLPAQTEEFIRLADFIKKEHEKSARLKSPEQKSKAKQIGVYKSMKERFFEEVQLQKGIQLKKAA